MLVSSLVGNTVTAAVGDVPSSSNAEVLSSSPFPLRRVTGLAGKPNALFGEKERTRDKIREGKYSVESIVDLPVCDDCQYLQ